jgi:hypothetical protein
MDALAENSHSSGKPSNANKPSTPNATKMTPHASEPPSSRERQCFLSPAPTPNPMIEITPGPSAADTTHHSDLAESLRATSPIPQPQGPGTSSETPIGGDSAQMPEEIPCK